jgi:hypothetical protein
MLGRRLMNAHFYQVDHRNDDTRCDDRVLDMIGRHFAERILGKDLERLTKGLLGERAEYICEVMKIKFDHIDYRLYRLSKVSE